MKVSTLLKRDVFSLGRFFASQSFPFLMLAVLGVVTLCFTGCLTTSSSSIDLIGLNEEATLKSAYYYFDQLESQLKEEKLLLSEEECRTTKENTFDRLYQALLASSQEDSEVTQLCRQLVATSWSLGLEAIDRGNLSEAADFFDEILMLRNILPRPLPPGVEKIYKEADKSILMFETLAIVTELSKSRNILLELDRILLELPDQPVVTDQPTIEDLERKETIYSIWQNYFNSIWNSRYASFLLSDYRANYSKYSKSFDLTKFPSNPISMSYVVGDGFLMGSAVPADPQEEKPVHTVYLNSFFMGQFEVTQELFQSVLGQNNSRKSIDPKAPVDNVNWYDAILFCNLLSQDYGLDPCYDLATKECDFSANGFRLPSEAEWEFAAKGGIKRDNQLYAGGDYPEKLGWFMKNSEVKTHSVGQKAPNSLNLYDMTGNLWEWCNDWFAMYNTQGDTEFNPTGPLEGSVKVRRGGSWMSDAHRCRNTSRIFFTPGVGYESIGFRLVRNGDDSERNQ